MMTACIMTERLILRPFVPEDAPDLFAYLSREDVVRFEPYPPLTWELAVEEARRRADQDCFIAVCLKKAADSRERLIGNVYFQRVEPEEAGTWEMGYVFHPDFQKQGYATEACLSVIDRAFSSGQARRIIAHCNPENARSWKLLERLGFVREGHLRQNIAFHYHDGQPVWQDTFEYGLLRHEWIRERRGG